MLRRDPHHDAVKNALIKDGWVVTHDPYTLEYGEQNVYVDLAAESPIAAEKEGRRIAVEVEYFISNSAI